MASSNAFAEEPQLGRCEKCREPATHQAQFRRKKQRLCCRHYQQLVDKLLEMIEEIRQAVR